MKANRNVKDSVFSMYLTENAQRLVEVYNAVQGTDYPLDTPVEINTLRDVLYKDRINDISFTIDNKYVVLSGHQSTINMNIPVRALLYIGRVYEKILSRENIYRKKQIPLPTPEFIVFYNGNEPCPQETLLRLSDAFIAVPHGNSMDLMVKVLNIRDPDGNPVLKKSRSLREYSIFVDKVFQYASAGMKLEESIHQAVLYCSEHDVMQPFLLKHSSEVENMLLSEWNWDEALRIEHEEALEEGMKKGMEKGMEKGKFELIKSLLGALPDNVLAEKAGISLDAITKLRKESSATS